MLFLPINNLVLSTRWSFFLRCWVLLQAAGSGFDQRSSTSQHGSFMVVKSTCSCTCPIYLWTCCLCQAMYWGSQNDNVRASICANYCHNSPPANYEQVMELFMRFDLFTVASRGRVSLLYFAQFHLLIQFGYEQIRTKWHSSNSDHTCLRPARMCKTGGSNIWMAW